MMTSPPHGAASTRREHDRLVHDDPGACVASFSGDKRDELARAEMAVDIAVLLHRVRTEREAEAAVRAGLHQQAVSRLERPDGNMRLATLQRYLAALGYGLEISVVEPNSGQVVARVSVPPHRK